MRKTSQVLNNSERTTNWRWLRRQQWQRRQWQRQRCCQQIWEANSKIIFPISKLTRKRWKRRQNLTSTFIIIIIIISMRTQHERVIRASCLTSKMNDTEHEPKKKEKNNRLEAWLRRRSRPRCHFFFFPFFGLCFLSFPKSLVKTPTPTKINGWRERLLFAWTLCTHGRLNSNEKIKISEMRKQVLQRSRVFDIVGVVEPKFMNSAHSTNVHTQMKTNERVFAGNSNLVNMRRKKNLFISLRFCVGLMCGCALYFTPINFGLYLILPRPLWKKSRAVASSRAQKKSDGEKSPFIW